MDVVILGLLMVLDRVPLTSPAVTPQACSLQRDAQESSTTKLMIQVCEGFKTLHQGRLSYSAGGRIDA